MPVYISKRIKDRAVQLRKKGFSYTEISQILQISKSTCSIILKDLALEMSARERLIRLGDIGREKGLKTMRSDKIRLHHEIQKEADSIVVKAKVGRTCVQKVVCAVLYWGEGGKTESYVSFINSDEKMIASFLKMIRSTYALNESKFRALVHIHPYHNENQIKEYWSKITNIPISQFTKSYLKQNSGKNINVDYKGTLKIKYYDYKIALELKAIYNSLVTNIGL